MPHTKPCAKRDALQECCDVYLHRTHVIYYPGTDSLQTTLLNVQIQIQLTTLYVNVVNATLQTRHCKRHTVNATR